MRWTYVIAVVTNRGIALLNVLALSHLMSGLDFGRYALIAVNALTASTLAGTWLATSATRMMATHGVEAHNRALRQIGRGAVAMILMQMAIGVLLVLGSIASDRTENIPIVLTTLVWAVAMLIYDVTLAAKNGLSADHSYMNVSVVRNVCATALSVVAAFTGLDVVWVVLGQIVGILISLICSAKAVQLIRAAFDDSGKSARSTKQTHVISLAEMISFGWTGTLALSLLALVNSISRNILAHWISQVTAGTYALVSDLTFGPLTLLCSSYSLSRMASLYALTGASSRMRDEEHRSFVAFLSWICIPYGMAGYMTAADLVPIILPLHMHVDAVVIAPWVAIQTAFMAMTLGHTTLMLTAQLKRHVWEVAAVTLLGYSLAAVIAARTQDLSTFAVAMAAAAALSFCTAIARLGWSALPLASLMKSSFAALVMVAVMMMPLPFSKEVYPFAQLFAGVAAYLVVSGLIRPVPFRAIFFAARSPT